MLLFKNILPSLILIFSASLYAVGSDDESLLNSRQRQNKPVKENRNVPADTKFYRGNTKASATSDASSQNLGVINNKGKDAHAQSHNLLEKKNNLSKNIKPNKRDFPADMKGTKRAANTTKAGPLQNISLNPDAVNPDEENQDISHGVISNKRRNLNGQDQLVKSYKDDELENKKLSESVIDPKYGKISPYCDKCKRGSANRGLTPLSNERNNFCQDAHLIHNEESFMGLSGKNLDQDFVDQNSCWIHSLNQSTNNEFFKKQQDKSQGLMGLQDTILHYQEYQKAHEGKQPESYDADDLSCKENFLFKKPQSEGNLKLDSDIFLLQNDQKLGLEDLQEKSLGFFQDAFKTPTKLSSNFQNEPDSSNQKFEINAQLCLKRKSPYPVARKNQALETIKNLAPRLDFSTLQPGVDFRQKVDQCIEQSQRVVSNTALSAQNWISTLTAKTLEGVKKGISMSRNALWTFTRTAGIGLGVGLATITLFNLGEFAYNYMTRLETPSMYEGFSWMDLHGMYDLFCRDMPSPLIENEARWCRNLIIYLADCAARHLN